MPQPITVETIQNVMSQTKSIQVFDLQEAIVKRDPKMAKHYYNELRHNQTPLALLNWLFKTEVMRLLKLKLSDNPSQTVNQLGIHFSQKQLYLKNCATWHLNQLKQLLKQSEKLEACMIGYKPEQAPQIMLDLIYQLIYLPKCQTA